MNMSVLYKSLTVVSIILAFICLPIAFFQYLFDFHICHYFTLVYKVAIYISCLSSSVLSDINVTGILVDVENFYSFIP